MQLLLVSVCLAICSSALVSATETHYLITVPSYLEGGSQEKVCVTIQDLNCDLHLKLELQKDDQSQLVAEQDIKEHDFSHCYTFTVPLVDQDSKDWKLHVSGQGELVKINEYKKVQITKRHYSCVIQTDKSTYKPNDIVKLRILSVDHDFQPSNSKYEKIWLLDPNGNYIGQWLDVTPDHGFIDLNYHLAKELKLGSYRITIPDKCDHRFSVEEYVSKRFEVHNNLPEHVSLLAKSFTLNTCGKYTYGKPVQGHLDIKICEIQHTVCDSWRGCYISYRDDDDDEEESHKCIKITHAKTDSNGCLTKEIDLSVFNISASDRYRNIDIESLLTEDGTGQKEKASTVLHLKNHNKIAFEDTGMMYHTGMPFTGKIKVTDTDDKPLANASVTIASTEWDGSSKPLTEVHTDKDGIAQFTLKTDSWTTEFAINAYFTSKDDDEHSQEPAFDFSNMLFVVPFYSESHSFINVETNRDVLPCDSDVSLNVEYHINKNQLDSKTDHISFFYLTVNQEGIYSHKEYKLDITEQEQEQSSKSSSSELHGSFTVNIHLDYHLSPNFIVLVYTILPKGETVNGINHFEVSSCLANKVQLRFLEEQVRPGKNVHLEVSAEPGSFCSVRSLDRGYLLQYPHDDTSFATQVKRSLSRGFSYYRGDSEFESHQCPENQTIQYERQRRFDAAFLFEISNLNVITNTHIKQPLKCVEEGVTGRSSPLKKTRDRQEKEQDESRQHYTRAFLPDTWLFELVKVGQEGHTVLNLTTPHTITQWETDAVCIGKSGIGEIRNVGLLAFQNYFVDLIMPYSVVQGEKFKIEAQVFSYDKKCILVGVSLSDVDGIHTVQDKDQFRCVCDHFSHFSWDATASKLNEINIVVDSSSLQVEGECKEDAFQLTKDLKVDSVQKTLLVKARGYENQWTQTSIVYPADATSKMEFTLPTPKRMIIGSERAHMIVVGNIMGNIIVNLENILNLPDGCGEQSVSKLLRYCTSLEYLQGTDELTPKTKEEFLEHLVEGYQRQLTFRNSSGGFATFSGGPANLWITGLVVRALGCAKQFIHVDEKHIKEAIQWLETTQKDNGCFDTSDYYFYNDLDDDHEITETAFITISLLEHQLVCNESILERAKACMRKDAANVRQPHTLAILAYAFTLLGDSEMRELMLKHLNEEADTTGGAKRWIRTTYNHGDIEISSYAIMALLSQKIISNKDIEESADIVRWLASQQNPWGGFSSSQDTTLALNALAKYAKTQYEKKGDATVIIEDDAGFHKEVHIDQHNSLLVQTVDLPKVPGTYTASVTGKGCVYLQSHIHYFSIPEEHEHNFAVNVTTNPAGCTHEAQTHFEVHVDTSYIGKRSKTNMVVIKIELLSGFVPDTKSITKLKKHNDVQRVDTPHGLVEIYLNELSHENEHLVFAVNRETRVDNLQPANVLVYDYYIPEIHVHAEYNTPCTKAHCNVRATERQDCGSPGITKEQCEERGCCYDSSIANTRWCFFHETNVVEVQEDNQGNETQQKAN